ncbi:hypothetical protein [Pseudodesulfovibrio senegalensis]|nr:hypothetical protein [Pseudodesulfovibrio senegalensis]
MYRMRMGVISLLHVLVRPVGPGMKGSIAVDRRVDKADNAPP